MKSWCAMEKMKMASSPTHEVAVELTLTNYIDQALAEQGLLSHKAIRTFSLDRVLVDTGTTRLGLPSDMIARLGLKYVATVDRKAASGIETVRTYQAVELIIGGRKGHYNCVELPTDQIPRLGRIPLDDLGLEWNLKNHQLRYLPTTGPGAYLRV